MSSSFAEKKAKSFAATAAAVPAFASIEILSNGTTQMAPCALIRTPVKTYLFNCPEGTSRFLHSARVRSASICDIFITRASWDNIGGISGVLLTKDTDGEATRLHGPANVRSLLDCLRPFTDLDCPTAKYPVTIEERCCEEGSYCDAVLTVHYLPLVRNQFSSMNEVGEKSRHFQRDVNQREIAYLIELSAPPRRVNPLRLAELQIPKGPLVGRLKNGEVVELPDGRTIRPEDVLCADETGGAASVLVVECSQVDALPSLRDCPLLQEYVCGAKGLRYCVHFTRSDVMDAAEYVEWMTTLGASCEHIVANGSGPALPHMEGIYKHQLLLNDLSADLFAPLSSHYDGAIEQDGVCERRGSVLLARPLQRFALRGALSSVAAISIDVSLATVLQKMYETDAARQAIATFKKVALSFRCGDNFPRLTFLGSSSAVPSKYRNVSGYLLQLNSSSYIMVDCGEGSFGQLRVLRGEESCVDTLIHLKAVFITHAHLDHVNGLFTVTMRRAEAFTMRGLNYCPLIVVCPVQLLNPLRVYSVDFSDLERLLHVVCFTRNGFGFTPTQRVSRIRTDGDRSVENWAVEVNDFLPRDLFSADEWGLQSVLAVQVNHTKTSCGFIFGVCGNRKIVFSGDTKPCELLVEHGMGADLLVHEATFADGFEKDAAFKKHSTMAQAVDIGSRMQAKHIILTHFSARYPKVPPLPEYLDRAGNVAVAMDNLSVRFGELELLPKLIPVFRAIFREELLDMELRTEQRAIREQFAEEKQSVSNGCVVEEPPVLRKRKCLDENVQ